LTLPDFYATDDRNPPIDLSEPVGGFRLPAHPPVISDPAAAWQHNSESAAAVVLVSDAEETGLTDGDDAIDDPQWPADAHQPVIQHSAPRPGPASEAPIRRSGIPGGAGPSRHQHSHQHHTATTGRHESRPAPIPGRRKPRGRGLATVIVFLGLITAGLAGGAIYAIASGDVPEDTLTFVFTPTVLTYIVTGLVCYFGFLVALVGVAVRLALRARL
jgi:hypothetical protein